ncbi:MAG: UDP-N-acetylmuramate dehydrogenase, partial [Clostridia bacterium]|nr:UDP-N-acetylmuramate dehydrogenase [Deltaproteobacteria bacterium]
MSSKDIYFIGICGTGVGALAGLLKAQGHHVRGSDVHSYPPMSDKLREWGIPVIEGHDAKNLDPQPDLVIIGNVVRATNPEAVAVRERNIPHMSMPQAIAEFGIGEKHS